MSIAHLKKQAKNLVRLLPDHFKNHPEVGSLAACQELVAQASGYPSLEAVLHAEQRQATPSAVFSDRLMENLRHVQTMVSTGQNKVGSTDAFWMEKSKHLLRVLLGIQLHLEAKGSSLPPMKIYDLSSLETFWAEEPDALVHPELSSYLLSLSDYCAPQERGAAEVKSSRQFQHGFVTMFIANLRKEDVHPWTGRARMDVSSDLLQQQAKRLIRLLPAYQLAHPHGGGLAACQELLAKSKGFSSFHAATRSSKAQASPRLSDRVFTAIRSLHARYAVEQVQGERCWLHRAYLMAEPLLVSLLHDEALDRTVPLSLLYDFNRLEAVSEGASPAEKGVAFYLHSLPGYEPKRDRLGAPVAEDALAKHGYVTMVLERDLLLQESNEKTIPEASSLALERGRALHT